MQKTFDGSTPVEVAFDETTMTAKEVNGVLKVGAKGAISKTITNASTNVSITGSAKPYLFTVTDSDITSDKFVLLYPLDETTETWLNENSLSSIITEASGKFTFKVAVNTLPSTYSMKYFIQ